MADLATLQAQLEALKTARNSGVLIVRHGDEQVTYRSRAEIDSIIDSIQGEIDKANGVKKTPKYIEQCGKGY